MTLDEALRVVVRAEVREAVTEALADLAPKAAAPVLLDRASLALALDCSLPHIDKMRRRGMPHIRLGDVPRFVLADVLAWLRSGGAR